MRWIIKAGLVKVLSHLPAGSELYYLFQCQITKSLPSSDAVLHRYVAHAIQHLENFERYSGSCTELSNAAFFEFGAGWDLVIPLTYWYLGVRHQTIVDIRRGARPGLIADTMKRLGAYFQMKEPLGIVDRSSIFPLAKLEQVGIKYLAPVDAAKTGLHSYSFDFISNTFTLEHIPANHLSQVLRECFRLLKPSGIMSCLIDMTDHYSIFDKGISRYNFLKFSPAVWMLVNSPLHFQNRLRYPDYIDLARRGGLSWLTKKSRGQQKLTLAVSETLDWHTNLGINILLTSWGARQHG